MRRDGQSPRRAVAIWAAAAVLLAVALVVVGSSPALPRGRPRCAARFRGRCRARLCGRHGDAGGLPRGRAVRRLRHRGRISGRILVGDMTTFASFLAVAVVVIVTPGPTRRSRFGARSSAAGGPGLHRAAGVSCGQAVWTIATSAGLAALLAASEPVFRTVKLLGAAYLVLLGAQALLAAVRSGSETTRRGSRRTVASPPSGPCVPAGAREQLDEPEDGGLLPRARAAVHPVRRRGVPCPARPRSPFSLLTFAWLSVYAAAVARVGEVLRRPRVRRVLEAVTGAILVALGVRLATERR